MSLHNKMTSHGPRAHRSEDMGNSDYSATAAHLKNSDHGDSATDKKG